MSETFPVIILPHRVHLSLKDCVSLFGAQIADELNRIRSRDFKQTKYSLKITGPAGELSNISLFLPFITAGTQIMLTKTDTDNLGIKAPICSDPGDCGTPGLTLSGPSGSVHLGSGAHIPQRRIYLRPKGATDPKLRKGDLIFIAPVMSKIKKKDNGSRTVIFGDVTVLYCTDYRQGFYIDSEEAAASNLENGDPVRILGKPSRPEYRSDSAANRKKRLITENDVRQAIMNGNKIEIESWMIATPAARELGKSHNILIEK